MKAILFFLTVIIGTPALALTVIGATLDEAKENILVDIEYRPGQQDHQLTLKLGTCLNSDPVRCEAELVSSGVEERGGDLVKTTAVIPIKDSGLLLAGDVNPNKYFYAGGSLFFRGVRSSAEVTLPVDFERFGPPLEYSREK